MHFQRLSRHILAPLKGVLTLGLSFLLVDVMLCVSVRQECHTESVMLAGTGLGMLLNLAPAPLAASQLFWSLHKSLTSGCTCIVYLALYTLNTKVNILHS